MDELIHSGLILYGGGLYRFQHDRIQEAAHSLISEQDREALHAKIGRSVLSQAPPAELPAKIFYIVDQFNQAVRLIQSEEEKRLIAGLNLKAGIKAKEATAYAAAASYLQKGMALLPAQAWTTQYDLTYALHKEGMICEYLNRNFKKAEWLFTQITRNAQNRMDRARAYHAMTVLYTNIGKLDAAIDLGLEGVQMFGVRLPKKCGKLPVLLEILRFKAKLRKIPIETIVDLPLCADKEILSLCELYGGLGLP
ncbi:MAG: serine/threonine protein kinase, partial [Desulfobacterales bacterium]|nr:serine/threonine protein kinase [Desulfobacterales bacterium]